MIEKNQLEAPPPPPPTGEENSIKNSYSSKKSK